MLHLANSRLDDGGMECIWDQTDDKVVLCDLGVEGLLVAHIEGDWVSELDAFGELSGRVESTACLEGSMARYGQNTEFVTYQQSH